MMNMNHNNELTDKIDEHHITLYGKDGEFGIVHKVAVIWRSYVWILCTISAILGYFAKYVSDSIWK